MRRTLSGRPQFQTRGLGPAAQALLNNGRPFRLFEFAYRSFLLPLTPNGGEHFDARGECGSRGLGELLVVAVRRRAGSALRSQMTR